MFIMNDKKEKQFTYLSRLKVRIKRFYKRFDIEKAQFESLPSTQQKAITIARLCIQNKNSKLYSHPKTSFAQIELPELFITISQAHGFYEVDIVYINQQVPTSDKVIFDSAAVQLIYSDFDKEVIARMKNNISRKDKVVDNHLDNLLKATERLSETKPL